MTTQKIETIDSRTLMDLELPPIRFIVNRLLPQGLHILAGAAKTGKSWLLLLLSLKVAQGEPFWDLTTEKGTVLSLCLEDSLTRIQQRLMELTEEAPSNLHFATPVSYTHLDVYKRQGSRIPASISWEDAPPNVKKRTPSISKTCPRIR